MVENLLRVTSHSLREKTPDDQENNVIEKLIACKLLGAAGEQIDIERRTDERRVHQEAKCDVKYIHDYYYMSVAFMIVIGTSIIISY